MKVTKKEVSIFLSTWVVVSLLLGAGLVIMHLIAKTCHHQTALLNLSDIIPFLIFTFLGSIIIYTRELAKRRGFLGR